MIRARSLLALRRISRIFETDEVVLGDQPMLSRTIQPVIESLLFASTPHIVGPNLNLSGSAGATVPTLTVPAGLWYFLIAYRRAVTIADSQIYVRSARDSVNIHLTVAATVEQILLFNRDPLREGDQIGCLATGNGGDTAISSHVWYYSVPAES